MENQPLVGAHAHGPPFDRGFLKVSEIHTVYYEQYGNRLGKPAIFLHDGPGDSTSQDDTVYFNPLIYRVVLLDQRGCGRSTPNAEVRENTSPHLVADLETLRRHLSIRKWHLVFGGGWGSTLALLYAQSHPEAVGSLVLRGVRLYRKCELDWLYYSISPIMFPDVYLPFKNHIPEEERGDLVGAYYRRLTSGDRGTQLSAALRWNMYKTSLITLKHDSDGTMASMSDEKWLIAHCTLEAHYAVNGGFIGDGHLLRNENVNAVRHIPAYMVQGQYDMIAPAQSAYDLYSAWPESAIYIMNSSGHSAKEPQTRKTLIFLCDNVAAIDYN